MSFGSSWSESSWSNSFSGTSSYDNKEAEGTHNVFCGAYAHGWCKSGWVNNCCDEKCSGCLHDRHHPQKDKKTNGNVLVELLELVGSTHKEVWV